MKPGALPLPAASDSKEELADWLELRALSDGDQSSSLQDLIREFRRNGSLDALENAPDRGSADSERLAESAFSEVEDRMQACGPQAYPFVVKDRTIDLKDGYERYPYIFQLLLTAFGLAPVKGSASPEKTFEEMAAIAARRYLGPDGESLGFAFGFPRRYEAKNFHDALTDLCRKIGEGSGAGIPSEKLTDATSVMRRRRFSEQKDGKLDIVAWRPFPDRRSGKLIGFGQCATGKTDWRAKMSELQPDVFEKLWLAEPFSCSPIRMFFVPRRIEEGDWRDVAAQAGIVFDRCRIAHHCGALEKDASVADECSKWTSAIVKARLRSASGFKDNQRSGVRKRSGQQKDSVRK
jgi:hypothetical protein